MTETSGERTPRTPGCPVCRHARRRDIENDLFLADKSPRHIAEILPGLSRRQIARHMRDCPLHPQIRRRLFERMCISELLRQAHAAKLEATAPPEEEAEA